MIVKSSWNGPRAMRIGQGGHIGGAYGGANVRHSPWMGHKFSPGEDRSYTMHHPMKKRSGGARVTSSGPSMYPMIHILS